MSEEKREKTKKELNERAETLLGYLDELETERVKRNEEVKEIKKDIDALLEYKKIKEDEVDSLKNELLTLGKDLASRSALLGDINAFNGQITALKSEITDLMGRCSCATGEWDTWNNKIMAQKEENETLSVKRESLIREIESLEKDRKNIIKSNADIQDNLAINIAELKSIKSKETISLSELLTDKQNILDDIDFERKEVKRDKEYAERLVKSSEERAKEFNYQIEKMKEFVAKADPLEINPELKGDLRVLAYSINKL